MEYVRREMKAETQNTDIIYHIEPDTARVYEAMSYAQDFTEWDDVNGFADHALELIVV